MLLYQNEHLIIEKQTQQENINVKYDDYKK